jgi:flagellar biosynthetic protein FlhB
MSREQDLDRNEKATPYKLDEARKRGTVTKSRDLVSLAVLLIATIAFFALAASAVQGMAALLARGLVQGAAPLGSSISAVQLTAHAMYAGLEVLAPLLFLLVVVVVGVNLLNSGPVFSTTPLKPDLSRLNPMKGFKRLFSMKLVYEAGKSVLVLLALVFVSWLSLQALLPGLPKFFSLPVKAFMLSFIDAAGGLMARLCAVLAFFALVDVLFTRWEFMRTLRMSRREIEDETKHRDGDPRIKSRLRELRLEFLKRTRSVSKVPQADVLITNPTHISVALRYRHGQSPAPQVLAKGAGGLAHKMRDVAFRSGVPIVHSPLLARALFKEVEQEDYVPERWYPQVAKILAWVQAMQKAKAGRAAMAQAGGPAA